jgi:hypothetical protein
MIAWGARRLCRRRTIAGGHGEAERSERGGGGGWGAEGRSEPFEGSHVHVSEHCVSANLELLFLVPV